MFDHHRSSHAVFKTPWPGDPRVNIQNAKRYTYRVTWSLEDGEHVGLCAELPSLSWLARTPEAALRGIQKVVADVVADILASAKLAA